MSQFIFVCVLRYATTNEVFSPLILSLCETLLLFIYFCKTQRRRPDETAQTQSSNGDRGQGDCSPGGKVLRRMKGEA